MLQSPQSSWLLSVRSRKGSTSKFYCYDVLFNLLEKHQDLIYGHTKTIESPSKPSKCRQNLSLHCKELFSQDVANLRIWSDCPSSPQHLSTTSTTNTLLTTTRRSVSTSQRLSTSIKITVSTTVRRRSTSTYTTSTNSTKSPSQKASTQEKATSYLTYIYVGVGAVAGIIFIIISAHLEVFSPTYANRTTDSVVSISQTTLPSHEYHISSIQQKTKTLNHNLFLKLLVFYLI